MKKKFCIFFQSLHQVDMKNVVKCHREFIAYFNALETTCGMLQGTPCNTRFSYTFYRGNICSVDEVWTYVKYKAGENDADKAQKKLYFCTLISLDLDF